MKHRIVLAALITVFALGGLLGTGCKSNITYYSPYRADGTMTVWAHEAITQGVGVKLYPNVSGYPESQINQTGEERYGRREWRRKQHIANKTAFMLGGWDYIAQNSDQYFKSPDKLARVMVLHRNDPQFGALLDAAFMLFPQMRPKYYQLSTGLPDRLRNK